MSDLVVFYIIIASLNALDVVLSYYADDDVRNFVNEGSPTGFFFVVGIIVESITWPIIYVIRIVDSLENLFKRSYEKHSS